MNKRIKIALITCGIILGVFAIVASGIFGATFANVEKCIRDQRQRISDLKAQYSSGDFININEQSFCDFNIEAALQNDVKLVDVQFLGTHNSYKKEKSTLEKFYSKLSADLAEGNYDFETPTEQLNAGVRSMEFDLFGKKNRSGVTFHSFHIGYADMSSTSFDFAMCLEELDLWSLNHPDHLPITIILEPKERGGAFPYLPIKDEWLDDLDALIKSKITNLFTPSQAFEGYKNINEMRASKDSPTLKETMGKIIFILHPSSFSETYIDLDRTYKTQAMFPSGYFWWDKTVAEQQFVIINNHGYYNKDIDECGGRINEYLVRIMLDNGVSDIPDKELVQKMLTATNATICSTNHPPRIHPKKGYENIYFAKENKTVKLIDSVKLSR